MKKDDFFMSLALQQAEKAFCKQEVPVGAVVVKKDKLLSQSHNFRETSQNLLGHAEFLAIQLAGKHLNSWRLQDCELYVSLEPCLMCMGAIVQSRISRLIYACPDPKAGFSSYYGLDKNSLWTHKIKIRSGVGSSKSSKLLKQFFKEIRLCKKTV